MKKLKNFLRGLEHDFANGILLVIEGFEIWKKLVSQKGFDDEADFLLWSLYLTMGSEPSFLSRTLRSTSKK